MRYIFSPLIVLVFLLHGCKHDQVKPVKNIVSPLSPEPGHILLVNNRVVPAYADSVRSHLQKAFVIPVQYVDLPQLPVNLLSTLHKDRYRADSILRYLQNKYKGQALKVILLTHHDISTTKYSNFAARKIKDPVYRYKDWAIFGLGSCPGYTCVVSDKRLWARKANRHTFLKRLKNISVHEVGHTFGLPHCPEPQCVMNDANETILTVDRSAGTFCEKCKLQMGFKQ